MWKHLLLLPVTQKLQHSIRETESKESVPCRGEVASIVSQARPSAILFGVFNPCRGSSMQDRSKVRGQMKYDPLVLQIGICS